MRSLFLYILMLLLMACSGSAPVSVTNSSEARDADGAESTAPKIGFDPTKMEVLTQSLESGWHANFEGELALEHYLEGIGKRFKLMLFDVGLEAVGVDPER